MVRSFHDFVVCVFSFFASWRRKFIITSKESEEEEIADSDVSNGVSIEFHVAI